MCHEQGAHPGDCDLAVEHLCQFLPCDVSKPSNFFVNAWIFFEVGKHCPAGGHRNRVCRKGSASNIRPVNFRAGAGVRDSHYVFFSADHSDWKPAAHNFSKGDNVRVEAHRAVEASKRKPKTRDNLVKHEERAAAVDKLLDSGEVIARCRDASSAAKYRLNYYAGKILPY